MTDRVIVITSIAAPTGAVIDFAARPGWQTLVVGDRKTPDPWQCDGVHYLSPAAQSALGFALADALPWNHYCRKMLGYLEAIRRGAGVIVDTDDDNYPKPDWAVPAFAGDYAVTAENLGFVNVYASYTGSHVWPRGFPLDRITDPAARLDDDALPTRPVSVGIWQGLVDEQPDVDAIYRLVDNRPVIFDDRAPIVLGSGTLCPFNSQNTAFRRELFPLLYLPAHVTFRFTDILRGLVAQPLLWQTEFRLGFHAATVIQQRNPHRLMQDFEQELPVYRYAGAVPEIVAGAISPARSLPDNLRTAYTALHRAGIVPAEELPVLDAWLTDLQQLV